MQPSHVNGLDAPKKTARVKVGASEYEIQWGPLAEYILSSRGLTVISVLPKLNAADPRALALKIELFRAFTAHLYKTGELPAPEEIAARLLPGQIDDAFMAMRGLLIDAKLWRPLEPEKNVPAPTPEPTQDQAPKA
jgi:hypothetical protein